jgi:uncharacterized protein YjbI with pentapeptide repeats
MAMTFQDTYQEIKQVTSDYLGGHITRALAEQSLIDHLCRIDAADKRLELTKSQKNLLVLVAFQHLSLFQGSPGPNSLRNFFKRGSAMLNATSALVITGLDFSGLSLPEFKISNSLLIACNFDESDLRGGQFNKCQLQGCSFRRADLSNANFRDSAVYGCGFEDANTRNTKGLS